MIYTDKLSQMSINNYIVFAHAQIKIRKKIRKGIKGLRSAADDFRSSKAERLEALDPTSSSTTWHLGFNESGFIFRLIFNPDPKIRV